MSHSLFRTLCLSSLCLAFAASAGAQPKAPANLPLRALIVSGGPDAQYNQYAIESNARYVESLTVRARSKRILFANGHRESKTISTIVTSPQDDAKSVFAWMFDEDEPDSSVVLRAPTLKQLDGPSTKASVIREVTALVHTIRPGENGLVYFTGHGSPGEKPRFALLGPKTQDDYDNTLYSLWGDDDISVKELARPLQSWPSTSPLVLIMVQCHAGGFANLIFQGGNLSSPIWDRDFCGFFAATGDRQASGCTSEVDERDYQDFTTHFFAALSGISRDGRKISGADYDHNGVVSMLEAYAWTNLHDASIDVPECTSDAYLRSLYGQRADNEWQKTPYSKLLAASTPWQKAILQGLSQSLGLGGEGRVEAALVGHARLETKNGDEDSAASPSDTPGVTTHFDALRGVLLRKFPGLRAPHSTLRYRNAKTNALRWMPTRPAGIAPLAHALDLWGKSSERTEESEAAYWRFVRAARTIVLQDRLKTSGTPAQKAIFARLRRSEGRNPLG